MASPRVRAARRPKPGKRPSKRRAPAKRAVAPAVVAGDPAEVALAWLRALVFSLPGTVEVHSWGHPNFKVGGKIFAAFERYRGEDVMVFKTDLEHQRALIATDARFYASPYVGKHGWVSMRVAGGFDEAHTRSLVTRSYGLIARPAAKARKGRRA